jgi:hypothetical protein
MKPSQPQRRKQGKPTRPAAPKSPPAKRKEPERTPSDDRIAERAYELYEQRGCLDGHALEDWTQAEREIRGAD